MSTAEIAIAALAAAIGTTGAVTALGTSKSTGPTGTTPTGPAPILSPTAPAPTGPTGTSSIFGFTSATGPAPTGPTGTASIFTLLSPTGGPTGNRSILSPTGPGARPNFAAFKAAALEVEGLPSGKGRRRVSTLRRKPKTRSKNGRRSPHKSASRGDR